MGSLAANRCVDHQLHLIGADLILDVGAPLVHLEHRLHLQSRVGERLSRA